jgi:pectinesterase
VAAILSAAADGESLVGPDAIVAQDGSGQYTSVQEAIDHTPARSSKNDRRWIILIKPGTYREVVYIEREFSNLAIIGEDAEHTVLTYDLNAKLTGLDGKPIGTFRTPTLYIDADGAVFQNLTVANTAAPGAGQGLALRVDADRVAFRNCRFLGFQDTVLLNRGRQYFDGCTIEGLVDFIFGGATAFFQHCQIRCLHTRFSGFVTAASTPEGQPFGFVFGDCRITGPVPDRKSFLGRPWRNYAKTVFINTEMSAVISRAGWDNWDNLQAEKTTFYAEYHSTGPGSDPAGRVRWIRQLTDAEALNYTVSNVLGGSDGWNPEASLIPKAK